MFNTYYIKMRPPAPEIFMDWANYKPTSKYAKARELRFRARHRK